MDDRRVYLWAIMLVYILCQRRGAVVVVRNDCIVFEAGFWDMEARGEGGMRRGAYLILMVVFAWAVQ